ncbi:SIMPL domain-containing protein [Sphingomonas sp. QA11]|uniref:SIMPL domain-containing protein n=1 Tax=Sphingomonas sp. QA11 TaxID=2950605 RepID=UPI002349DCF2|nr:SIMPL domain-containing protein [Sphingomonas sp. QA11]WCM26764.1 SIMPL domain-containing protein [Sphingomonas sp. QA11]
MRFLATAVALAALPLTLSPAAAQVTPTIVADGALLDVTAQGQTSRVPDIATIRAGVVTQGATAALALAENAKRMAGVLDALKRAGVAPRDNRTANVSLSPQYRYADGQPPVVTGYQASNSVAIRFRDIAKAGAILDALVAQGANQIDGPTLSIDQPEAALDEARADAVKIARARAELYARAAGLSVSRIVSISEAGQNDGSTPQPVMFARAAGMDASTRVVPGETDVTVSVTVRFLLK